MSGLKLAVVFFAAVLNGMKTVYAIWNCSDAADPFWKVWNEKKLYYAGAVSLAVGAVLVILDQESLYFLRCADLFYTYLLLAIVDRKTKKVPDSILLVFLISQLLLAGTGGLLALTEGLLGSVVFSVAIILTAVISGGKMGMGDAKLLAVTAITAGWGYTLTILCIAMALSVVYGLWLLLFRHLSAKEEVPFVPFLFLGTLIHLICLF